MNYGFNVICPKHQDDNLTVSGLFLKENDSSSIWNQKKDHTIRRLENKSFQLLTSLNNSQAHFCFDIHTQNPLLWDILIEDMKYKHKLFLGIQKTFTQQQQRENRISRYGFNKDNRAKWIQTVWEDHQDEFFFNFDTLIKLTHVNNQEVETWLDVIFTLGKQV